MGRVREFDVDQALDSAMNLFWSKGYEATSISDLVQVTGVHRGSLYATFGDKHALFLAAVKHYLSSVVARQISLLRGPRRGVDAIRAFFDDIINISISDKRACGCLVTNSAAELAAHDKAVAEVLRESLGRLEDSFVESLLEARESGAISGDHDPLVQARFLTSSLHGLRVSAKLHPDRDYLNDVVDSIMASLR